MLVSHIGSRLRAARKPLASLAHSHALSAKEGDEAPRPWSKPGASEKTRPISMGQLDTPTTIVRDKRTAARVVATLMSLPEDAVVAWDTETTGLNPAKESPVGNGSVICATAFAGDSVDFGSGPRLFVDCLDGEDGKGLLDVFKGYFENQRRKKVWHNYAFDRHVLANHGIVAEGFGGDSMHMARLENSALQRYSLQELCRVYLDENALEKHSMVERFGRNELLKDGSDGKRIVVPCTTELQRSAEFREEWVDYATADAELTYRLCNTLKARLEDMEIAGGDEVSEKESPFESLYELYRSIILPFGSILTDIERTGFKVDVHWLRRAQFKANEDRLELEGKFRAWAETKSKDARYMNVNSDAQKQFFFFAPYKNEKKKGESLPAEKSFCIRPEEFLSDAHVVEIQEEQRKEGLLENGNLKRSRKLKKDIVLKGLGKQVVETTASGWPSVSGSAMQRLAGRPRAEPPQYGDEDDPEMCLAVDDLISASRISTLVSTFIGPLQSWPGKDGRIHASLNLNTETGRLSSRRPNLQNQPAFEKDRYKVRKAFVPEEGNSLIVADYGQLELRLLAHITNCKSMIEAFEAGGDFHSRTAVTMFDEVAAAVERGDCLLEREEGTCALNSPPLVKDVFSAQRRKAKTLNFSIAYGKTVRGLAKDWNVSDKEAKETVDLWYKERKEVSTWQKECIDFLYENHYVKTILGRRRHLPDIASHDYKAQAHAKRAAINAPLQGSAADLVMAAMVNLHQNRVLSALGWKIILQVHDEIILEGPDESAAIAMPIVIDEMKNPIDFPLRVDLTVDAKSAKSWYEAK